MKAVLLAGGMGTRLMEETQVRPKPLVEIGGRPVLWHIMSLYAHHGICDFIVAAGYKGEMIKDYFRDFTIRNSDLLVHLGAGTVKRLSESAPDWTVTIVDTGVPTMTGGRIARLRPHLGGKTFCATYGDGVGDIDLRALFRFHQGHGRLATLTAVRPPARFGGLELEGDIVTTFSEKPQIGAGWINGGYFVFEPGVLDYIEGDASSLEREPLERLAADGELMAFRHHGFWQPMDTLRDKQHLETLWASGKAPWKVWP